MENNQRGYQPPIIDTPYGEIEVRRVVNRKVFDRGVHHLHMAAEPLPDPTEPLADSAREVVFEPQQ